MTSDLIVRGLASFRVSTGPSSNFLAHATFDFADSHGTYGPSGYPDATFLNMSIYAPGPGARYRGEPEGSRNTYRFSINDLHWTDSTRSSYSSVVGWGSFYGPEFENIIGRVNLETRNPVRRLEVTYGVER